MSLNHGNLVPTPIVDKNGKATTVHRKNSPAPVVITALNEVSPTVAHSGSSVDRPFIPTKKQEFQRRSLRRLINPDKIDSRIPHKTTGYEWINYDASDTEVYDVLSVTRDNITAMMLLNSGARSAEEARTLLVKYDADNLIDDRSELAQKALSRRLDPSILFEFGETYNPSLWHTGVHLDRYLDGIELYSFSRFRYKKEVLSDVLSGAIRFSDIKTIGIRMTDRHFRSDESRSYLRALADGSATYTAEQLRDSCKTAGGHHDAYWTAMRKCQQYGGEWASGINWMVGNLAHDAWMRGKKEGDEKEIISYANEFYKQTGNWTKITEVMKLSKAGIPVAFAAEKLMGPNSFTVEQIIAMNAGVPAPMATGWI